MKYITRTVWILSIISLLTDTASEMLYPIMPIYLKSIGFSIVLIGILEGVAEATAGIGTFSGLQSICTMLASSLTGLIWFQFGAKAAFFTTATATLVVIVYFLTIPKYKARAEF